MKEYITWLIATLWFFFAVAVIGFSAGLAWGILVQAFRFGQRLL